MEDKIHITVWRDGKPQKRELGRHTEEDGTLGGWFKVTVSVLVTTAFKLFCNPTEGYSQRARQIGYLEGEERRLCGQGVGLGDLGLAQNKVPCHRFHGTS